MILCDLDMVLATAGGKDTTPGEPIHRLFTEPPSQLQRIRQREIPFHIVTAKLKREAWEVLKAIGLAPHVDSVIGAEALFWPSIWTAFREGRRPNSISKVWYTRAIQNKERHSKPRRVVMIDDRRHHLTEMLASGCIDAGILVPPLRCEGDEIVEWFDLDLTLRIASRLVTRESPAELARLGCAVFRWSRGQLTEVHSPAGEHGHAADRYLVVVPTVKPSPAVKLHALDTGHVLQGRCTSVVAIVRATRALCRRMTSTWYAGSPGGSSRDTRPA